MNIELVEQLRIDLASIRSLALNVVSLLTRMLNFAHLAGKIYDITFNFLVFNKLFLKKLYKYIIIRFKIVSNPKKGFFKASNLRSLR